MNRKIVSLLLLAAPLIMLIISIIVFILNTRIAEGKPCIYTINPQIASRDEIIEISGKNFGDKKDSSKIYLSSVDLISKYIFSWSDNLIKITVPDKVDSGLILIKTANGESEPVVFVLNENTPFIGTGAYLPGLPFIEKIDPVSGGAGSVITIYGENFGFWKNNRSILFSTRYSREADTVSGDAVLEDYLHIADEFIISWSNNKISFYLPESIVTGNVYIKSDNQYSNAYYFENTLENSRIELLNKKNYMIHQSVRIEQTENETDSSIHLWFPLPVNSIYQRNRSILSSSHDYLNPLYKNLNHYKIKINSFQSISLVSQNIAFDIYERNYIIDSSEINNTYNKNAFLYKKYTESTEMIPSSISKIRTTSSSITKGKYSGYSKAKAIYDYIVSRLSFEESNTDKSPLDVLNSGTGNSKDYSLLFCALARSAGIPARPVVGVLVISDLESIDHWWAEIFLEGFGWYPLDPALADNMLSSPLKEEPFNYYWGNLDNRHIEFSKGQSALPRLFPDGEIEGGNPYSNLTHSMEIDNKITKLHSIWSDVIITSIY